MPAPADKRTSIKQGRLMDDSIRQHVLRLLDEVADFLLAYLDNDKEKMIKELTDIKNACELVRRETTKNE